MRAAVRLIDALLCKQGGLFEFSQANEVILRLQLTTAAHPVMISNENIAKGEPVLALHVWNERMPKIPPTGVDLGWALQFRHRLIYSFKTIANLMQAEQIYSRVSALCGVSALFSFSAHTGGTQMMQHLGFTVLPYYRPMGRFGEFWENLFSWWLMWTYNTGSLYTREFWRLERTEIWITRADFLRRYGLQS